MEIVLEIFGGEETVTVVIVEEITPAVAIVIAWGHHGMFAQNLLRTIRLSTSCQSKAVMFRWKKSQRADERRNSFPRT